MLDSWPRDKLIAVALLIAAMTPESKAAMVRIKSEDLFPDHTGMAAFIRKHFGLWEGNTALIESCACDSPEDATMAIIEMTWNALQSLPNDRLYNTSDTPSAAWPDPEPVPPWEWRWGRTR